MPSCGASIEALTIGNVLSDVIVDTVLLCMAQCMGNTFMRYKNGSVDNWEHFI